MTSPRPIRITNILSSPFTLFFLPDSPASNSPRPRFPYSQLSNSETSNSPESSNFQGPKLSAQSSLTRLLVQTPPSIFKHRRTARFLSSLAESPNTIVQRRFAGMIAVSCLDLEARTSILLKLLANSRALPLPSITVSSRVFPWELSTVPPPSPYCVFHFPSYVLVRQ